MKYNVILAPSFIKTLRYTLNQYKYFSTTYATKIEKRVYESINFLSLFPFCAPSIKLKGKSSDYRKFIIKNAF